MDLVKILSEAVHEEELPEMNVGDTVRVLVLGSGRQPERPQAFEGTIIAKKHGGINETITVRRISYGWAARRSSLFTLLHRLCHHRPQGQGPQSKSFTTCAIASARRQRSGGAHLRLITPKAASAGGCFLHVCALYILPVLR